ncbi:MAG TPA: carbohydrate ABC transporter permease [bacterium]|jgi:multiple sugar transport system permease protein
MSGAREVMLPRVVRRIFFWVAVALLALWSLAPIYWIVVSSISTRIELYTVPYKHWIPQSPTLQNYIDVFTTGPKYRAGGFLPSATLLYSGVRNSILVALLAAALLSLLASLAGYAFARLNFRGRSFLFFMMLLLVPLPIWVSLIALFQLMSVVGLIDTKLGLVLLFVAYGAPLYVWLMQTYIRATPRDIEEAALIDGASRFRALRTIILPVAFPGLVSVFLVAFLTVWNAFLIPLIFTNSESAQPLTVVLSLFIGQYEVAWEAMSAAAVVTMIPPIVMALFFQRYIVRGLALGALQ